MLPFTYHRASSVDDAVRLAAAGGAVLAGGTELVPWMRDGIAAPGQLIDIGRLPLRDIEVAADGGLRLGAGARLAEVERHPEVLARAPVLARAVASAASPAIRAMGTLVGNLLQQTRCPYFRAGPGTPCNRREPGTGCSAIAGDHRGAAVLGVSEACIAAHPSDPAVALVLLDAELEIVGRAGRRAMAVEALYRESGHTPELLTTLGPGDLVVEVRVPPPPSGSRTGYVKVRDRAGFDFALVSAAALVDASTRTVRLALGAVAPRPWRCRVAEQRLSGAEVTESAVADAVRAELAAARSLPGNAFKVELALRAAVRAVLDAAA